MNVIDLQNWKTYQEDKALVHTHPYKFAAKFLLGILLDQRHLPLSTEDANIAQVAPKVGAVGSRRSQIIAIVA